MPGTAILLAGWADQTRADAYVASLRIGAGVIRDARDVRHLDALPTILGLHDLPSEFTAAARQRAAIQHDTAIAFWRKRLGHPSDVVADGCGFLANAVDDLPQHAFAYWLRTPDGELAVLPPGVGFRLDSQRLVIDAPVPAAPPRTAAPPAELALGVHPLAGVSGWDIMSEIGNLASLAGMMAMSANPAVGGVVMIGGSILSFIFQQVKNSNTNPPDLPSADRIRSIIVQALSDEYVRELGDQASAILELVDDGIKGTWNQGSAPNDTAYHDWVTWLDNAVDPTQGATVTMAATKIDVGLADQDSNGWMTGLQHFPAFLAAAGIEIIIHQFETLRTGAESGFGTGPNPTLNAAFRTSVERGLNRTNALLDAATQHRTDAADQITKRLARISAVTERPSPDAADPNGTMFLDYVIRDSGGYPALLTGDDVVGSYSERANCCDSARAGDTIDTANTQRDAEIERLRKLCAVAYGVPDGAALDGVIANWKKARDDLQKTLNTLK
ncbi:hypothetical protein Bcav_2658 [Beutenbergia cavernae DSM 12333]|uniref:Uncharacterized protein n=2 Tax=Beutenbergia TaxID=84756 RepID=C5BXM0_BEUC1|nr:hypothetical protein Bcav_2658 [Beutenbergia cavernae DSM 12333]